MLLKSIVADVVAGECVGILVCWCIVFPHLRTAQQAYIAVQPYHKHFNGSPTHKTQVFAHVFKDHCKRHQIAASDRQIKSVCQQDQAGSGRLVNTSETNLHENQSLCRTYLPARQGWSWVPCECI
jgi:hypothetical protein